MTVDEIQTQITEHRRAIAELWRQALATDEMRSWPGLHVRNWLESNGATQREAQDLIIEALNARRRANGQPDVGQCSRRR